MRITTTLTPEQRAIITREYCAAGPVERPRILRKYNLAGASAIIDWLARERLILELKLLLAESGAQEEGELSHPAPSLDYACAYRQCPEYPITVSLCEWHGARFACASHLGWLSRTESRHAEIRRTFTLVPPDESFDLNYELG